MEGSWCQHQRSLAVPSGNSVTAWDTAAAANHLYEIREPVGASDVSAKAGNKNILTWAQPDEPDGIYSQVPHSAIQHNYNTWTSLDPNHQVYINFVGNLNQYDLQSGASGIAWYQQYAAGANWISADHYPVNNGENIDAIGTEVGTLRQIAGNKPVFAYIETGAYATGDPVITANQFRAEVWEAIIHGVRGIWYFPVRVSPSFSFDVTPASVVSEMTAQDNTIHGLSAVLQGPINPSSIGASVPSPLQVAWRSAASGDYFIVLNLSNNRVNRTVKLSGVGPANTASVYGQSRSVAITNATITDSFAPYAVHIYQVHP